MRTPIAFKALLLLLPSFLAGGLSYYSLQLFQSNVRLTEELQSRQDLSVQLQEQQQLNLSQRQEFEGRIQQLQTNLQGAQAQMTNLSAALQEARELINAATAPEPELTQTPQ